MSNGLGIYGNHIIPTPDNTTGLDARIRNSLDGKQAAHNTKFEQMSADKLARIVSKVAKSNQERQAEAISLADARSWLSANPQFLQTPSNVKAISGLLRSWNIDNPNYADFQRAYTFADGAGILDLDGAEIAKQQDHPLTTDALDELIANNRHHELKHMPAPSEDEEAFDALPNDQALTLIKELDQTLQRQANSADIQKMQPTLGFCCILSGPTIRAMRG